jgi:hypothetical protein
MDYRALLYSIIGLVPVLLLSTLSTALTWWILSQQQDDVVNPQIAQQHTVAKKEDLNL